MKIQQQKPVQNKRRDLLLTGKDENPNDYYNEDPYAELVNYRDYGLPKRLADFVDTFIRTGNRVDSALAAGYSYSFAKTRTKLIWLKPGVKEYYKARMKYIDSRKIAKAEEVLQFLSKAMRGEINEQVIVCEGLGGGLTRTRKVTKQLCAKDRIRAAELLAKRYALLTENFNINTPPVIVDDINSAEIIDVEATSDDE